jgi:hypothetical protein
MMYQRRQLSGAAVAGIGPNERLETPDLAHDEVFN